MIRTTNRLTTTLLALAWSPVLPDCSRGLIAAGNRSLFAGESADVETARPEPGGVRELRAAASQAIPLANPDFERP